MGVVQGMGCVDNLPSLSPKSTLNVCDRVILQAHPFATQAALAPRVSEGACANNCVLPQHVSTGRKRPAGTVDGFAPGAQKKMKQHLNEATSACPLTIQRPEDKGKTIHIQSRKKACWGSVNTKAAARARTDAHTSDVAIRLQSNLPNVKSESQHPLPPLQGKETGEPASTGVLRKIHTQQPLPILHAKLSAELRSISKPSLDFDEAEIVSLFQGEDIFDLPASDPLEFKDFQAWNQGFDFEDFKNWRTVPDVPSFEQDADYLMMKAQLKTKLRQAGS